MPSDRLTTIKRGRALAPAKDRFGKPITHRRDGRPIPPTIDYGWWVAERGSLKAMGQTKEATLAMLDRMEAARHAD